MAMCVTAVVGEAPCKCFSPGANHTTSSGRNILNRAARALHPPCAGYHDQRLTQWGVCHAVRAPGSYFH